jgi:quercetin dioxygenase-like cupin family protein
MTVKAVPPFHSFSYDGARINVYHANKGEGLPLHAHAYSHATMCCSGSCAVREGEKELTVMKQTQPVNLLAGRFHEIEALEDGTVFVNVFADGKY